MSCWTGSRSANSSSTGSTPCSSACWGPPPRRDAYRLDGAVTLASWFRNRTRLDAAAATRRVQAAVRLPAFPTLQGHAEDGTVGLDAVIAVTRAAVANRIQALAAHDSTLADLAAAAPAGHVRVAVGRIAEHVDPDGTSHPDRPDPEGGCGPDPRRELSLRSRFDGLGELHAWLDQMDTELLLGLLDALDQRDPPDTPLTQQRSPGQRRADAFGRLLRMAAAALADGLAPGPTAHLLLRCDLADLIGLDPDDPRLEDLAQRLADVTTTNPEDLARLLATLLAGTTAAVAPDPDQADPGRPDPGAPAEREVPPEPVPPEPIPPEPIPPEPIPPEPVPPEPVPPPPGPRAWSPRLRWTGPLPISRVRHLARLAKVTVVLTAGPWRVVSVGRTMRTLPPWLRMILDAIHPHCRGPDCDRPAAWTEAHHVTPWTAGGHTDLNDTVPLCHAHHDLVTTGAWAVALNPRDGTCTWTRAADGTTRATDMVAA